MFSHPMTLIDRLKMALDEDVWFGDITTERIIVNDMQIEATLLAKESGIFSGGFIYLLLIAAAGGNLSHSCVNACRDAEWYSTVRNFIESAGNIYGPDMETAFLTECPGPVQAGDELMRLTGSAHILLRIERVGLNLIARMSGIATMTQKFVRACEPYKPDILSTRKTMPLWRDLEKLAVKEGGGNTHRMGLYNMILIKENHLAAVAGDIRLAIKRARRGKHVPIEVEVENIEQFRIALEAAPDYILLDNMSIEEMAESVELCRSVYPTPPRPKLEASGNIVLDNVHTAAATGIDRISIGALTHSVKSLDLSLQMRLLKSGMPIHTLETGSENYET